MKILLVASLIVVGFLTEVHAGEDCGDKTATTSATEVEAEAGAKVAAVGEAKNIDRELAAMRAEDNKGTVAVPQARKERVGVGKQSY
jgi:hypothetical protein